MSYPEIPDFTPLGERLALAVQLAHEHGASPIEPILSRVTTAVEAAVHAATEEIETLAPDPHLAANEPDALDAIQALRPRGPRRISDAFDAKRLRSRLEGALLGRFAGCTLGAPVEFWSIEAMESLASDTGHSFPPTDYWVDVPDRDSLRYGVSPRSAYTRDAMHGVPVDDDITYTLLGLLILERYGTGFSVDQVGEAWLDLLPVACTAEHVALENLRNGIPATNAAVTDNPYREWIGADIRADPWGYAAPGWPERAADFAWRDGYLSHRRQGIYGEMFFAAAISAAFTVDDPVEALRLGLTEIPAECALAEAIRWALDQAPSINDYRDARKAVAERFAGMHRVHTINNACLTVWGITLGGTDFTRVVSETVAMGMDNDCTAATAGSMVGAVVGVDAIPGHWTARFENRVGSYLNGHPEFAIDDLVDRFMRQAEAVSRLS